MRADKFPHDCGIVILQVLVCFEKRPLVRFLIARLDWETKWITAKIVNQINSMKGKERK